MRRSFVGKLASRRREPCQVGSHRLEMRCGDAVVDAAGPDPCCSLKPGAGHEKEA